MSEVAETVASGWAWLERITDSFWIGLGWPHAVLIIFVIAIANYRQEFKALIERILEIGPGGFKLQPPAIGAPQSNIPEVPEAQAVSLVAPVSSTPLEKAYGNPISLPPIVFPEQVRLAKDQIAGEIAGMSESQAKEYLIPMLAISRSIWVFENCYSCIYGGQIRLLQMLNQRHGRSMPIFEVNSYWAAHQEQQRPVLNLWTVDQYLHYLIFNGLIIRTIESIQLTVKGNEFLLWLINYSRPLDRPW